MPFQKSHRRKRSRSVEDDEEGHLICQSGDVLSARCIEYFSKFINFKDRISSYSVRCKGALEVFSFCLFLFGGGDCYSLELKYVSFFFFPPPSPPKIVNEVNEPTRMRSL